jgi:hypothetical protein
MELLTAFSAMKSRRLRRGKERMHSEFLWETHSRIKNAALKPQKEIGRLHKVKSQGDNV